MPAPRPLSRPRHRSPSPRPSTSPSCSPIRPAPYIDGNISVSPLPVIVGVPTTIHARLANPLTEPITVDVSFGYAQSGIGLAFGPIDEIVGQVIPANSSAALSATFLPPLSGHWCVQVSYTITGVGGARAHKSLAGGSGSQAIKISTAIPGGRRRPVIKIVWIKPTSHGIRSGN